MKDIIKEAPNCKKPECANFGIVGIRCDECSEMYESNWVHDERNIADGLCQSCLHKYNFVTKEPCKSCNGIKLSYFVTKSEE